MIPSYIVSDQFFPFFGASDYTYVQLFCYVCLLCFVFVVVAVFHPRFSPISYLDIFYLPLHIQFLIFFCCVLLDFKPIDWVPSFRYYVSILESLFWFLINICALHWHSPFLSLISLNMLTTVILTPVWGMYNILIYYGSVSIFLYFSFCLLIFFCGMPGVMPYILYGKTVEKICLRFCEHPTENIYCCFWQTVSPEANHWIRTGICCFKVGFQPFWELAWFG